MIKSKRVLGKRKTAARITKRATHRKVGSRRAGATANELE